MKVIRILIRVVGGLILMFSGAYFTTVPSTIIRGGIAMSRTPIADAMSAGAGTLEFFLGVALALSAFSVFDERRNSR